MYIRKFYRMPIHFIKEMTWTLDMCDSLQRPQGHLWTLYSLERLAVDRTLFLSQILRKEQW